MKSLLRGYQYDRHTTIIMERDYGKYYSPDLYQNYRMAVDGKTVLGLKDGSGYLDKSKLDDGSHQIIVWNPPWWRGLDHDQMVTFMADTYLDVFSRRKD